MQTWIKQKRFYAMEVLRNILSLFLWRFEDLLKSQNIVNDTQMAINQATKETPMQVSPSLGVPVSNDMSKAQQQSFPTSALQQAISSTSQKQETAEIPSQAPPAQV